MPGSLWTWVSECVRTSQGRGGALGLGDRDHGVTLTIRENGERGGRDLGSRLLLCASPGRTALNPLPSPLSQLTAVPASPRQPPVPAHKQHGGKGVAGRLGGEGGSRDSRAFLPISGVGEGPSGLSARRRLGCNFLRSSRIRVHPTPAASTMPPKFDPNEIKVGACFMVAGAAGWSSPSGPRPLRSYCLSHAAL